MPPPLTIDHQKVLRLYQEDETRSASAVAEMMGITVSSVTRILKANGVEIRIIRTGGPKPRALCRTCGLVPPDVKGRCNDCIAAYHRDYSFRRRYGITEAQRDAMAAAQDGRCALCDETPKVLVVDHCHETGVIRGMLCIRCNLGLGRFGDNVAGLKRAIAYLERGLTSD